MGEQRGHEAAVPTVSRTERLSFHARFVVLRDMITGLFRPIIARASRTTGPDGSPKDVDSEFIVSFAVFDRTASWYFEANAMNQRKYPRGLRFGDPALRRKANCLPLRGINSEL